MAWTAPRTWVAGEIVTASLMNTHIRDQERYLKGLDGVPTIQAGLTIDNSLGSERLLLPLLSTAECTTVLNAEGEVAFDEQTHRIKFFDNNSVVSVVGTDDVDDTPVDAATTDPISSNWAYDHLNVLTGEGSIPYATAARVWTELAKGTSNQFLQMNAGATAPQWTTGLLNCKIKAETRAMDAATGDVGYTTYGFQPKALVIFSATGAGAAAGSLGIGDVNLAELDIEYIAGVPIASTNIVACWETYNTKGQTAVLKTLDADGFTLTWTRTGATAAGTANFIVLALA